VGDFVPQTLYRGSAPGPRWGTSVPQTSSLLFCPPIILWDQPLALYQYISMQCTPVGTENIDCSILRQTIHVHVWFQALLSYIVECGYSTEQYELVTTFPRRNISQLDPTSTLRDCSLYPQDTVFVQERSLWYIHALAILFLWVGRLSDNILGIP